ncbi:hypothetical protein [Psychromonas sp. L1A2]|uniref:hypothetical protein n=1 Tax=Psychromonas sp. L1A2 TaxID=2686356 RepID=UPI0013592BB1|nr:hypothetical protein [Psychromonas sp. L1A2]
MEKLNVLKVCIWVKEFSHPIRVFGVIFFALALITGVIWSLGNEVEPIAFVLSLMSSLCFASPAAAEYLVPNRKPVKQMTYDELLIFIPTTDYKNDWKGLSSVEASEYFLKEDPRLRFRTRYSEDGIQARDFREPWANCYLHPHATSYWHELYYDGAFIHRTILISVDDGKSLLPAPDIDSGMVRDFEYSVAKIHDVLNNVDSYLEKSGLHRIDS